MPLCLSKYHSQAWLSSLCTPFIFLISVKGNSILPLLDSKFLKSPRFLSYSWDIYFIHNSSAISRIQQLLTFAPSSDWSTLSHHPLGELQNSVCFYHPVQHAQQRRSLSQGQVMKHSAPDLSVGNWFQCFELIKLGIRVSKHWKFLSPIGFWSFN